MKKHILTLVVILFSFNGLIGQEWLTDFTIAKEIASNENKSIILVFQGSDWCAPCIKLDKEVWSTPEFKELSKDYFVMILANFPRKRKNALTTEKQEHNNKLAEKYNPNGFFPYVVVLNPKGDILGNLGYEKTTPKLYFNKLKAFEK
ncbi:MAG: thioredoxin family protein [Flavobacteriaceae bacterium]|mgnify:FL=1|jgi:thioredoxin-related protein|nr:thioredoxin family protein [Flavobacteriaceae bacterium]MBT4113269.1 thioredoxin family protein [Flavobacteriaceae bacterium]MBT4614621.1 thioredoxin family protein [Flavobacteriaceae bacterium]MBT4959599.1 thioredoxin family protein [Flavobacteriaceae bacterium]MBT5650215.1 thioredoxin family protein [Flavobacteriaceae bacterium]